MNRKRRKSAIGAMHKREPPQSRLQCEEFCIEVARKPIRHAYIRVKAPDGRVCVSAPRRMKDSDIRRFVSRKLAWIRAQQSKLQRRGNEHGLSHENGETHFVWGRACRLHLEVSAGPPVVEQRGEALCMRLPSGSDSDRRKAILQAWYGECIRPLLPALLDRYEHAMGVQARRITLRHMKSRWGSCTPHTGSIRLNTSLAQWPPEYLEYVLVHELAHLLEPSHNHRFQALMDAHFPDWREYRTLLNQGCPAVQ